MGGPAQFYRGRAGGDVTEIRVRGLRTRMPNALTPDGSGNYFFVNEDLKEPSGTIPILRLTADGAISNFADISGYHGGPVRMARDPETGSIIVSEQLPGRLLLVSPDRAAVRTLVASGFSDYPTGLVEDARR